MNSVIIDNDLDKKSSKKFYIDINFSKVYLLLLILIGVLIYFYLVYQNNYLLILMPYRVIWTIGIMVVGISIFSVNNIIDLTIGLFVTLLVVGLTISSIFISSANAINNTDNSTISTQDASSIFSDINLVAVESKIKSGKTSIFKSSFFSNYDKIIVSNYRDENKIENIKIEQKLSQPGIGAYKKTSDIIFPNNTPIAFRINADFSSIETDLDSVQLESGYIKTNGTFLDMAIKNIKLEEDVVLSINANWSILNLVIDKDIPIIVSNSSSLGQVKFIGINENPNAPNVYQSNISNDTSKDETKEIKKLIINLSSTLSQITVTHK